MQSSPIDSNVFEVEENPYYKRLRQELRSKAMKKIAEEKKQSESSTVQAEQHVPEDVYHSSEMRKSKKEKSIKDKAFKDDVLLNAKTLYEQLEDNSQEQIKDKKDHAQQLLERMKYNGQEIIRHLSYKIDFSARKDEFKEMFKFNLQQSRSDNMFVSRFSQFKVGVVGQILTGIGVPIEELKKLKKQAFREVFEENCMEMTENIYNIELLEIVQGRRRRNKKTLNMFRNLQAQLIRNMNNIGRVGYWSKSRLLEEKLKQCKRIREEFVQEQQHLTYLLSYYGQEAA